MSGPPVLRPVRMQPLWISTGTLLLSILLPWPVTGQFHVIGPRSPVIAVVEEEIVLPCQLSPPRDAGDMEVRWYRAHSPGLVLRYPSPQDPAEPQRQDYRARAEVLLENATRGLVSLRVRPVHASDGGEYTCFFESPTYYNEAKFEVLVTGTGMAPHIHIESGNTKGIKVTCTSTGWYPEPEVQWKDLQGLHLTPASETKTIEGNGLFHVQSSIIVDKSSKNVSCVIRNPVLGVEKGARVSVADALFPRNSPWIVGLAVFVALLVFSMIIISILFLRAKKAKGSLKEENGSLKEKHGSLNEKHGELREQYEHLIKQKGKLHEELEKRKLLGEEGLKLARCYAEGVTLDRKTAHPYLQIAKDNKSVRGGDVFQDLPKCRQRFDTLVCVLGQQIFFKGKHYWEVSVKEKIKWTLGICKDSVCRQGEIQLSPEVGFWTLCLNKKNDYQALANPRVPLHLEESPEIVGIFLDYEAGRVSFYNVTSLTHIYTYRECFREALRPYFYPGPLHNGQNGHPLIIQN
ncbi:butyrophilin subfamily 1 member A1-like isoform X4 [Pteropus medius]|uniref:butyrophilin subfamily 1 member A1-like isoform X4 n=1 Tax=Pteropus vampyrus TaxID=132908 RepID=UPI00196AB180|nr:butyrophilin subfamily 1 member A1-like isoform X4 [Pteropus giganteus]